MRTSEEQLQPIDPNSLNFSIHFTKRRRMTSHRIPFSLAKYLLLSDILLVFAR